MQGFLGGDKGGSSNPLKQISQREGQDRGAFRVSEPLWKSTGALANGMVEQVTPSAAHCESLVA